MLGRVSARQASPGKESLDLQNPPIRCSNTASWDKQPAKTPTIRVILAGYRIVQDCLSGFADFLPSTSKSSREQAKAGVA